MAAADDRELVWVPHPTEAWVPCLKSGGRMYVDFTTNENVTPPAGFRPGPSFTVRQLLQDYPDMVKMNEVCEGSILYNLKQRFAKDLIYTNIGDILVSLNPYKWLNHYFTDAKFAELKCMSEGDDVPPHIWGIASSSYRGLLSRQDQSILISGESGAGKTEATKKE